MKEVTGRHYLVINKQKTLRSKKAQFLKQGTYGPFWVRRGVFVRLFDKISFSFFFLWDFIMFQLTSSQYLLVTRRAIHYLSRYELTKNAKEYAAAFRSYARDTLDFGPIRAYYFCLFFF